MSEIQNNNLNNRSQNWPYIVIIILLIIIAVLAFFIWQKYNVIFWGKNEVVNNNTNTASNNTSWTVASNIIVKVIWDNRCSITDCPTAQILDQLKKLPFLSWAKFEEFDFNDEWIKDFLKANNINALPAFLLNTKNVSDPEFVRYLQETPTWLYSLNIWAKFDPFAERSDKWFLLLSKDTKDKLSDILKDSYIKWEKNAKITWLEYSDIECPFCAKQRNSTLERDLFNKYGKQINNVFQHFPLPIHANSEKWWELLECIAEQKGAEGFFKAVEKSYRKYNNNNFSLEWLKDIAVKELWANKSKLTTCLDENKYSDKVKKQAEFWSSIFKITWTPWNVLINNETGEYQVIIWVNPKEKFEQAIDKLLE